MPETNLRSKDGYRFTADISGNKNVEGEIAVYDGAVYLLQNKADGSHGGPLRGYKCSWTVGSGSESDLEGHGVSKMKVGSNKIDRNSSHSSFKVGQRVRFKSSISEPRLMGLAGLAPGREGTITCVNSAGMNVKFDANGKVDAVYCDDMDPITLEFKATPSFKAGDRVKVKDDIKEFAHGGHRELTNRFGTVMSAPSSTYMRIAFDDGRTYSMESCEMEHTSVEKESEIRKCYFKVGDKVKVKAPVTDFLYGGYYSGSRTYTTGVVTELYTWDADKNCHQIRVKWDKGGNYYQMGDTEMEPYAGEIIASYVYRDGQTFSAKIKGEYAEGRISIDERATSSTDDRVFLCQNVKKGSKAPDMKGYDSSWSIRWGTPEDLRKSNIDVTELKLDVTLSKPTGSLREPKFKSGDKVKVKPEHARSIVFGDFDDAHIGCIIKRSIFNEDKSDWKYITEGGWNLIEYQFELVTAASGPKPKVALPKFKVGDVIRAKVHVSRGMRYGGNVSDFQHAIVIAGEDYPHWQSASKGYDYRVKTDHITGFIIWEDDFELALAGIPGKPGPKSLPKFRVGEILYPKSSVTYISYGGNASDFYGCIVESAPTWVEERSDWKYRVSTKNGCKGLCIAEKEFESHTVKYDGALTAAVFDNRCDDVLASMTTRPDVGIDTGWIDPKIEKVPELVFKTGPKKFSL